MSPIAGIDVYRQGWVVIVVDGGRFSRSFVSQTFGRRSRFALGKKILEVEAHLDERVFEVHGDRSLDGGAEATRQRADAA